MCPKALCLAIEIQVMEMDREIKVRFYPTDFHGGFEIRMDKGDRHVILSENLNRLNRYYVGEREAAVELVDYMIELLKIEDL